MRSFVTVSALAILLFAGTAFSLQIAQAQDAKLPAPLATGTWIASSPPPAPSGNAKGGVAVLPPTGLGKLPDPLPSGVLGNPQKPLSSQKMLVNGAQINQQIDRVVQDANERLSGVQLETGHTEIKPLSPITLSEDIESANRIHRMMTKRAEVTAATDLWGAAYDGKRENPPSQTAGMSVPGALPTANGAITVAQATALAETRAKEAKAAEEARDAQAQATEKARQAGVSKAIADQRAAMLAAMPVVSSLVGSPDDAEATVLVPYVGVQRAVKSGHTLSLYGGRKARVVSVTDTGVVISINGRTVTLDDGNSVPSLSQGLAQLAQLQQSMTPSPPPPEQNMLTVGQPPTSGVHPGARASY